MSLNRPIWKLRDWIDKEKLDRDNLSRNKIDNNEIIELIHENPEDINWFYLSYNKNAIKLLEKQQEEANQ
jgi:hypothetical protein